MKNYLVFLINGSGEWVQSATHLSHAAVFEAQNDAVAREAASSFAQKRGKHWSVNSLARIDGGLKVAKLKPSKRMSNTGVSARAASVEFNDLSITSDDMVEQLQPYKKPAKATSKK